MLFTDIVWKYLGGAYDYFDPSLCGYGIKWYIA